MAVGRLVGEVCSVEGEQERGQDPCMADYCVRHIVLNPHVLWPVGEVLKDQVSECEVLVHPLRAPACPSKVKAVLC